MCVHKMEYYLAIKKNEIQKWIELKTWIPSSEIMETKGIKYYMFYLVWAMRDKENEKERARGEREKKSKRERGKEGEREREIWMN